MFLSQEILKHMGFKHLGKDVLISDKASIYNPQFISIGDHSRIDDFCILSAGEGEITIGNHVHIACYCCLIGKANITLRDFSGVSSRTAIYSSTDDYSGNFMTNPTIPKELVNIIHDPVIIGKHSVIGSGCTILPGVYIGDNCSIGAMSLVNKSTNPHSIYIGIPAKFLKVKSVKLYTLENLVK